MSAQPPATLGIIAGGGRLPAQLIEACNARGRPCFVLAFDDATDINAISHVPHAVVRLGAVGEALSHFRSHNVSELVLAGRVKRPSFTALRPDMTGAKLLARLGAAFFSGDDAVLKTVITFLEEEGFKIVAANDILGALTTPAGILGIHKPDMRSEADITHGLRVVRALGELDIGQAVIVENGYVLGVEAAEGTDALIERCAGLKREERAGVLVKARKPGQDERADLPAIGVYTVEKMAKCGFSGIAVEAGGSLILDKENVIAKADELGLFIAGVRYE